MNADVLRGVVLGLAVAAGAIGAAAVIGLLIGTSWTNVLAVAGGVFIVVAVGRRLRKRTA